MNGHLGGDVISPVPLGELSIEYRIEDTDEPNAEYATQVFRDAVGGPTAKMVTSVSTAAGGGSGVIEDIAITNASQQYLFFKIAQFNEDGDEEYVWTAAVWFQSQPDVVIVTPGPGPNPGGSGNTPSPATDKAVASRNSNTFHVSDQCFDAQCIKPANLVKGAEARLGRRQHQGGPRTTGPR